jgi:hypothetical protein
MTREGSYPVGVVHLRAESAIHMTDVHRTSAMDTEEVRSTGPKFMPNTVIVADPVVGAFLKVVARAVTAGES